MRTPRVLAPSRAWVLALAAILASSRGALAAEDGGTRSPLAGGVGSRPLALGGAFAGIAEGPDALVWNPAGLARVTHTGFEATHAQQPDLGASEEHVSFVLSSWRWGAVGVGVHHIGVGDIEARDDRNGVVGSPLSAGETEISVGYARMAGEAWSFGGALKLQSQSLGDFNASALAADAGVHVLLADALPDRAPSWLRPFSFGLSIRNLLEPSLRLDRDGVRDPRVLRAGLGWRGELFGGRALTLAFDLDRSQAVALRPHAGAELRLHPLLALRGGLNDGRMTAGAGMRWRDLEVSYGFDGVPTASVHRVGLSQSFGPSVSQRREAARQAEEQSLQTRLDREFQSRRVEQLDGLLARAEEALGQSDFTAALEMLAAAATLDSADARVPALETRAQKLLGLSLERSGDMAAATVAFERALALAPADTAAQHGALRTRRAIGQKEAREAGRRRRMEASLDALARGDLTGARAGFAALVAADSADTEARTMLRRTDDAIGRRDSAQRRAESVRSVVEPPPRAPVAVDPRKADELFRRGVAAMSAKNPHDALRFWEAALSLDPSHRGAAKYVNREYLVRGMDAYAAGRLDEAVVHWEKARRADPSDERAAGFLQRARERAERSREILGGER